MRFLMPRRAGDKQESGRCGYSNNGSGMETEFEFRTNAYQAEGMGPAYPSPAHKGRVIFPMPFSRQKEEEVPRIASPNHG